MIIQLIRSRLALFVMIGCVWVLTGCLDWQLPASGQITKSETGLGSTSEPGGLHWRAYEDVTLCFLAENVTSTDNLEWLIPQFEEKTGIQMIVEKYPADTVVLKSVMDFSSGAQTYDVVSLNYSNLVQFAEKNYIQPIDRYLENSALTPDSGDLSDIMPDIWRASSFWQGQCYGFPSNPRVLYLWYRKDLLEHSAEQAAFKARYGYELSVPDTPQAYADMVQFFTRKKGDRLAGEVLNRDFYGIVTMSRQSPAISMDFQNWMLSFGGSLFKDQDSGSSRLDVQSAPNQKALAHYSNLVRQAAPGSLEYSWEDVTTAMQQNVAFSAVNFSDQAANLLDANQSDVVGKIGFSLTPHEGSPSALLGASTFILPSRVKNPEASYLFMSWASSCEIQKEMALLGSIPVRTSVFADPEVQAIPFMPVTQQAMTVSRPLPQIERWNELDAILYQELHKTMSGRNARADTLKQIELRFSAQLER